MTKALRHGVVAAGFSAALTVFAPAPAAAYEIDCAILICLAGGWPTSTECAAAKAEFIRRITPFPIEPPLQIWRCPLGVSFEREEGQGREPRLYRASAGSRQSVPFRRPASEDFAELPAILTREIRQSEFMVGDVPLHLVGDYSAENGVADVDISGDDYEFVRSIRVFSVEYARQSEQNDGDCSQTDRVKLGTYGPQGAFGWSAASVADLPDSYEGLEGWGRGCRSVFSRAVFVDWTDYEGNYGSEQVDY